MKFVQVSVTAGSRDEALALARSAVEGRLAACAQVSGPITSVYRWQGVVEEAQEWLIVYKTTAEGYDALEAHVRERHTYEVPEILGVAIDAGNAAYLSWMSENS